MMRILAKTLSLLAIVAIVLVLSGCDGFAITIDTPSPSPTSTATATPAVVVRTVEVPVEIPSDIYWPGYVTAGFLSLRSGCSETHSEVKLLSNADTVRIYERGVSSTSSCEAWSIMSSGDTVGCACEDFISVGEVQTSD